MGEQPILLDPSLVGAETALHQHSYGWQQLATYAFGVGATRDELVWVYEDAEGGMRVLPTYAVVPAYPAVIELLGRLRVEPATLIHSGQRVVVHRQAPARATVETRGRIAGLYDLKRFAQLVVETRTEVQGEPLFDTSWTIIVRGAGGFGGPRPPRRAAVPRRPAGSAPDWVVEETTRPEQALLYRVSGDPNAIHVDDALARAHGFERGAILHGLCTFGFVGRAVLRQHAGAAAAGLRVLAASFRRPVWPGDTLRTEGYDLGDGRVALRTMVAGQPEPVLADAWAELSNPAAQAAGACAEPPSR